VTDRLPPPGHPLPRRPSALSALAAATAALALGGCGAESVAPQDDHLIQVPAEAATIQDAIDQAGLGDQIVVADGDYTFDAPVVVPTGKPGLVLRGADGTRPRLVFAVNADSVDAIIVLASNVSVRSFDISGTFRVGILYLPGGSEGTGDVSDCIVRGARWYAVEAGSGAADITIQRNVLVDSGIFGVIVANDAAPLVQNNTIVRSGDCAIYVDTAYPTCVRNVLVESVTFGIACFGPIPPTLGCNVLFDNGVSDYSVECIPGPDDRSVDPMFCDPAAFTLMPDSPCAPANAGSCQGIGAVTTVCTP
jgi:hypothetical protein